MSQNPDIASGKLEGSGDPAEAERLLQKEAAVALNIRKVDPEALKGRFTLPLLFSVAAAACGSSFIFGYNIGVINPPGELIKQWIRFESYRALHNRTIDEDGAKLILSWTASAFPLGGIFGGMLCGLLAEKFGRKGAMLLNNIFCFIGGLIMGLSKTANVYPMLILGRIIIGFNCGLNSGLAPMYLTEIAPINLRGMLGTFNQLMVTVSIWVSNLFGFDFLLGNEHRWPMMFGFTIVPAIWQVIALPFCPESPRHLLIVKGQQEAAEKALKYLRKKDDVSAEMKAMQEEADEIAKAPKVTFSDMFRQRTLRWALTVAVMMMLAQQFSGINAAMFFSSTIFREYANITDHNESVGASLGMNTVNVVMTLVSTLVVDRLGRRILMLSGMTGMWVSSILTVICLHLVMTGQDTHKIAMYCAIIFICLFVASFAIGPGPIPWFFVNELFDQGARGNANAVAVMTNWVATFIVGLSFLPWQDLVGQFAFLAFTGFLTFFIAFVFFYAPETKGRQLEEVKEELRKKAPC